jgi:hypothetical protein
MRAICIITAVISALTISPLAIADTITWNFTDLNATFDGASPTNPPANFTVSTFNIGNTNGTVATPVNNSSASNLYAGASGGGNVGNAVKIGALNLASSSYYEVTFTPNAGYTVSLTDFDFGTRSTSTGPRNYSLRSSLDNYVGIIEGGSIGSDSVWSFKNNTFAATAFTDDALTLRLYTYNGAGSAVAGTINSRLDDISITLETAATDVSPVPLPAAAIAGPVLLGLVGVLRRRGSAASLQA